MRDYCFTLNNWTLEEVEALKTLAEEGRVKYICWGEEIAPTTGTPHLQGYVEFPRDRQIKTISKLPGCSRMSLFARAGTQSQAIAYTKKEGPWVEFGTKKAQGARTDLKEVMERLKTGDITMDEIVLDYPELYAQYGRTFEKAVDILNRKKKRSGEMPTCLWYWGATGTGKSHAAFTEAGDDAFVWEDANGWWDGYTGQKTVVLNEFRGQLPYRTLLSLADKWDTKVPLRGREPTPFLAERIIVTSSLHPKDCYFHVAEKDSIEQLLRRFTVVEFSLDSNGERRRSDE